MSSLANPSLCVADIRVLQQFTSMLESYVEIEHANALVGKVADSPTCWISGYSKELELHYLPVVRLKRMFNVLCMVLT